MPRISERGTISSGSSWSVNKLSNIFWNIFGVVYLYFKSLIDPLLSAGSNASSSRSNSYYGGGPPRPPRRGGFSTFDSIAGPPTPMPGG
ncbi:selenoprotein K-like [Uloborus diversus]|uniref:selenoprotein K-like n=1 Tax=Uloborus diversus TaxID=327109 RepID=UPI00240A1C90|nr:selenoprotein K-like [Uloborus diversus]